MKHGQHLRKLGMNSAHRWATLRTMVDQLVQHERIKTTEAKALELRRFADWVVTYAKKGSSGAMIELQKIMRTEEATKKLITELAPRYKYRPGGYTRVLKVGWRRGDSANMAVIEFVDREGEIRPAKQVNEQTLERSRAVQTPRFEDFLPSRNWRAKQTYIEKLEVKKP